MHHFDDSQTLHYGAAITLGLKFRDLQILGIGAKAARDLSVVKSRCARSWDTSVVKT
jgi:hypothetical protein